MPEPGTVQAVERFPFSAVRGQDDACLALLLAAVDPSLGGVLLRGDKGAGKSTLARALAGLLPGPAPFVELPLGATEDRLVGSFDVSAALAGEGIRFRPGLLAAAHGGVLYVDEVNLLADHLVDALLDAAASGHNRVERDGVSHSHPARFVLVGSMNPEEGELRPQLLDRFGLAAAVHSPLDPVVRAAIVSERISFDRGGAAALPGAVAGDVELGARLARARPAALPAETVTFAASLALAVGAEGLRADLALCRAAAALAGWEGRPHAGEPDVERVAVLALAHRRRRRPFDPPELAPEELRDALDRARQDPSAGSASPEPADATGHPGQPGGAGSSSPSPEADGRWADLAGGALDDRPPPLRLAAPPPPVAIRPDGPGAEVGSRVPGPDGPGRVALSASIRAGVHRRAAGGEASGPVMAAADLREPVLHARARRCLILTVDTSGSMESRARVEAATGAVLGLLADAYRTRHRVALVTFGGGGAVVALPPTGSVELARVRLGDLPTGGVTPLAEGLEESHRLALRVRAQGDDPLVVVLTDARATAGPAAVERALTAGARLAADGIPGVVLDAEAHRVRLGLAARLARAMAGTCLPLAGLSSGAVEGAIRAAAGDGR